MSPPNRPLAITRSSPEYNTYNIKRGQNFCGLCANACVQDAKKCLKRIKLLSGSWAK